MCLAYFQSPRICAHLFFLAVERSVAKLVVIPNRSRARPGQVSTCLFIISCDQPINIQGLQFPVGRVHRLLKKGNYAQRVGAGAPGVLQ